MTQHLVHSRSRFAANLGYTSRTFIKAFIFNSKALTFCNPGESGSGGSVIGTGVPGVFRLPTYRLYRLDGAGNISSAEWIEASADNDALDQASKLTDGASFELWERGRLVDSNDGEVPDP
jgi:hypothetical protein